MPRYSQKPDSNQAAIDLAAQSVGAEWIQLSKLPGAGADRLYLHRGRVYLVEIKNPAQRWAYTESELRLQEICHRQDVGYYVIETPQDLADMFAGYAETVNADTRA